MFGSIAYCPASRGALYVCETYKKTMPLIIQRGGRGRLDEWLVPGRLISQWMELRAKMSVSDSIPDRKGCH